MKILIVDDHPLIREALRHVLTVLDADIKLIEAQNFADGLAAVADHADLDLILLDLGLPEPSRGPGGRAVGLRAARNRNARA